MNKRVQRKGGEIIGQVKLLWWWVTVRRFSNMPDALTWLGYGTQEEETEQV